MKKMPLFYHETKFSWYNSRKAAIILFLWPDDAQALPAPVSMANYTIPLTLHGIIKPYMRRQRTGRRFRLGERVF